MLVVLLIWGYIFGVSYILGKKFMELLKRIYKSERKQSILVYFLCGIIVLTLYAQVFSLFYKVGLLANIIMILICISIIATNKKENRMQFFRDNGFRKNVVMIGVACILALITAGLPKIGDTYLYHAQTIRWIEEYGCVPGIANVISRLGFNSSIHALNALFSMSFLFDGSLHVITGWFLFLLFLFAGERVSGWKKRNYHFADLLSIAALVYVLIDTAWISSPITDTPANCIIFIILILWIGLLEDNEKELFPYILLSILILFAATIKFSVIIIALLAFYPGIILIREKKWKIILISISLGIIVLLPFLIRNVITSGWLLYPFATIDFFDVDWKVPIEVVKEEANNVTEYGRFSDNIVDKSEYTKALSWVSVWFATSSISHKVLYLAVGIYTIFQIIYSAICLKKRKLRLAWVWLDIVMLVGLLYWFLLAPHVRFGWGYLMYFLICFPIKLYEEDENKKSIVAKIFMLGSLSILALYGAFYLIRSTKYVFEDIPQYLIFQADYIDSKGTKFLIDDEIFYLSEDSNPGYNLFPAIATFSDEEKLELRGNNITDGIHYYE